MDAGQLQNNNSQFGTKCKNKSSDYPSETEVESSEAIEQSDIKEISISELNAVTSNSCMLAPMPHSNGIDNQETFESIKKKNCYDDQHENVNFASENGDTLNQCIINKNKNANVFQCDQLNDERNDCVNEPLLFEHERKSRKPKSIVKSPSSGTDKPIEAQIVNPKLSLPIVGFDAERPVLHVQFQHQNSEGQTGYSTEKSNQCSSPASSVSSTSSSSSSSDDESIGYSEAKPPDGGWGNAGIIY